jgi:hypothetical protein
MSTLPVLLTENGPAFVSRGAIVPVRTFVTRVELGEAGASEQLAASKAVSTVVAKEARIIRRTVCLGWIWLRDSDSSFNPIITHRVYKEPGAAVYHAKRRDAPDRIYSSCLSLQSA